MITGRPPAKKRAKRVLQHPPALTTARREKEIVGHGYTTDPGSGYLNSS